MNRAEFTDKTLALSRRGASASASYNEVRVWNRALSEGELMMNAIRFRRMGETAVVEGNP